jgi:tripartite-type tricarboxylate transporter receptor subunit TctC
MLKLLCAALLSAATVVASAQDKFPARPIQVIITSTPGSTSDVLTRFLGAEVQKVLGQPLVVIA